MTNPFALLENATSSRTLRPQLHAHLSELAERANDVQPTAESSSSEAMREGSEAMSLLPTRTAGTEEVWSGMKRLDVAHTGNHEPVRSGTGRRGVHRSWLRGSLAELDTLLIQLQASSPSQGSPARRALRSSAVCGWQEGDKGADDLCHVPPSRGVSREAPREGLAQAGRSLSAPDGDDIAAANSQKGGLGCAEQLSLGACEPAHDPAAQGGHVRVRLMHRRMLAPVAPGLA